MEIKVKVYINNIPVEHEDLHKYQIRSTTIDRIVNDVIKRCSKEENTAEKDNNNDSISE